MPQKSRVFVAVKPAVQWGWNESLTNKMVYLLETLVWQKSKDAQKKRPQNRPTLFVPDFLQGDVQAKDVEAHTTAEIKDILAMPRV